MLTGAQKRKGDTMSDKKGEAIIKPIAYISTDFTAKFGIPRQSGLVKELKGRVVFEPEYRREEALRGLEGFTHIWLIWQFSQSAGAGWNVTVRPPRLGGNRRVGVFASRSPFRPNSLGLSCVRLESIDYGSTDSPALLVSGADLLDGTPIYDVKPYIPIADCLPEAADGYTDITKAHRLAVDIPPELLERVPQDKRAALAGVLSEDPRPGYDEDPEKEYGLSFAGLDVGFRAVGDALRVFRVEALESNPHEGSHAPDGK